MMANREDPQSSGTWKSKPQWAIISSHLSVELLTKIQQITSVGEDMEKREHSCTVGGNVNWYSHYGEQYGGSLKNYK